MASTQTHHRQHRRKQSDHKSHTQLSLDSHSPPPSSPPVLATAQRPPLWGRPLASAKYGRTHDATGSSSACAKHKGLHPLRKLAAKATWLWGLVGKQGMQASPRDVDSSHLHGGACQRPAGRHPALQCRHLRPQTLCRLATRAIRVAALITPEEKSKQGRGGPNRSFTDTRDRLPPALPIEFLMTVVASPSAEQLPRIHPRPGRETTSRRILCAPNAPPANLV